MANFKSSIEELLLMAGQRVRSGPPMIDPGPARFCRGGGGCGLAVSVCGIIFDNYSFAARTAAVYVL
jgi:hypothetical protein